MSTTKIDSVVAVQDGGEECGAMVYWALSGEVDADKLEQAWTAENMGDFENPSPTENTALRRTLNDLAERHRLIRPLEKRGNYAVVDETVEGDDIRHRTTVRIKTEGGLIKVEPYDQDLSDAVEDAYYAHLKTASNSDISGWLTSRAEEANAVPLRPRGGLYFIPKQHLARWRQVAGVLKTVSDHSVYEIPALSSEEAVKAILDAISREAEATAETFEQELIDDELGPRALNGRVDRCKGMQVKIKSYESLLGKSLDSLQERLVGLEAQLAAAALTAMTQVDSDS